MLIATRARTGAVILAAAFVFVPISATSQQPAAIHGRVLESASGNPVASVIVYVVGGQSLTITDEAGRYRLSLPVGRNVLSIYDPGASESTGTPPHFVVHASLGSRTVVNLTLPGKGGSEASVTREELRTGARIYSVPREAIRERNGSSRSLFQLIQSSVPGLRVDSRGAGIICIESVRDYRVRGGIGGTGPCPWMVMVVVDGTRLQEPERQLSALSPHDIESIRFLNSAEAGVRYGTQKGFGVLVIERRGSGRG